MRVLAVVLALMFVPVTARATEPLTVLYVGDSVAAQNSSALAAALAPASLRDATLGGTGICDYLAGTPTWLPASSKFDNLIREVRPDLVILQFWGNDYYSPCVEHTRRGTETFYDQYLWNAFSARREISAAADAVGLPRPKMLWVLQAPMPSPQRDVPRRLNGIYTYAADLAGDRVSDAGASVSMAAYPYDNLPRDRYEFTRFLPCTAEERGTPACTEPEVFGGVTRLRADNDDIHFCLDGLDPGRGCGGVAPGIGRYVSRISSDAKAWLGL
ncbi:hypothetical protein SAMN05192558_11817 [Actinokineospora alba]|uniref:GDSL-like Lipase/Acylhydrolase family protein n=1 Tax=Actinokineospora alba TaxID=504798 RepID=A0A1H0W6I0_9PSEU|nr:SGNH/GDSL hydrolase family protein [Actinokineospora alba]TDP70037.1 hypothetical protein C8E96_5637 [Actinokineospora alba]SDJ49404.1 hypothetical protein SAMN05421871_11717 [Actinokineospora alba]SDP86208.1 hypothetical protein SAMN05192558_11817 [Actinokineospora alba]